MLTCANLCWLVLMCVAFWLPAASWLGKLTSHLTTFISLSLTSSLPQIVRNPLSETKSLALQLDNVLITTTTKKMAAQSKYEMRGVIRIWFGWKSLIKKPTAWLKMGIPLVVAHRESIHHSIIILMKRLDLTLSILPCLQGRIIPCTPWWWIEWPYSTKIESY